MARDYKPMKIGRTLKISSRDNHQLDPEFGRMLVQLAIAEAYLVKAGKDSALPHFLAIVKELEKIYGFRFMTEEDIPLTPL